MTLSEHQENNSFSNFIFDYEQELVSIWNHKLEGKISKVLSE